MKKAFGRVQFNWQKNFFNPSISKSNKHVVLFTYYRYIYINLVSLIYNSVKEVKMIHFIKSAYAMAMRYR